MFILLATAGGAGSTSIILIKNNFIIIGFIIDLVFIFIALGIFINYREINKIKNEMKKLQIELNQKRIENE